MVRCLALVCCLVACGGGHDPDHPGDASGDGSGSGSSHPDGGGGSGRDAAPPDDGTLVDADPACAVPGSIPAFHAAPVLTSGLVQPVYVAQPPGTSTDLYVVQKQGKIILVRSGAIVGTFLDVSSEVQIPEANAEGGLLSMAFAADYATSGRFFVYMSVKAAGSSPDHVAIREYHRSANADVATPSLVAELFTNPQNGFNSLGGTIAFGPDGYLWLGEGDAANGPDAQDLHSRRGKFFRVDIDHPSTPPPNGLGGDADPFIWDYGVRNPYRFSFDRQTHELYFADSGDESWEEVNIEAPGDGHHDYGWDRMEGKHCHDGSASCGAPGTLPVFERAHESEFSVIIGGVVYRGSALPCLRGRYLYGIFGPGRVLSWVWNGTSVTSEADLSDHFSDATILEITSFGQDNAGEVYVTTLDGNLYKIVPD